MFVLSAMAVCSVLIHFELLWFIRCSFSIVRHHDHEILEQNTAELRFGPNINMITVSLSIRSSRMSTRETRSTTAPKEKNVKFGRSSVVKWCNLNLMWQLWQVAERSCIHAISVLCEMSWSRCAQSAHHWRRQTNRFVFVCEHIVAQWANSYTYNWHTTISLVFIQLHTYYCNVLFHFLVSNTIDFHLLQISSFFFAFEKKNVNKAAAIPIYACNSNNRDSNVA